MQERSMTALVSAFARAHHSARGGEKVFDDCLARRLLTDDEWEQISRNMAEGIGFFNPAFAGTREEALRWIVDRQLSPTPLGRAAFAEAALHNAVQAGARQYMIFAAGYDTFAYRQPGWAAILRIFEIDHPATARDKRARLARAGLAVPGNVHCVAADLARSDWPRALTGCAAFDGGAITFCSLLGLTYYLTKAAFGDLAAALGGLLPKGSALAFDYPLAQRRDGRSERQAQLARAAHEEMLTSYGPGELEDMLARAGFAVYEDVGPEEMTARFFAAYNRAHPRHPLRAFEGVCYCLAVKQ